MFTLDEYNRLESIAAQSLAKYEGCRKGQAWSTALAEISYDLACELVDTPFDPWYDDESLPAARQWLWEKTDQKIS